MQTHKDNLPQTSNYEPPAVERVLSQEDIEREAHYAGTYAPKKPRD